MNKENVKIILYTTVILLILFIAYSRGWALLYLFVAISEGREEGIWSLSMMEWKEAILWIINPKH